MDGWVSLSIPELCNTLAISSGAGKAFVDNKNIVAWKLQNINLLTLASGSVFNFLSDGTIHCFLCWLFGLPSSEKTKVPTERALKP